MYDRVSYGFIGTINRGHDELCDGGAGLMGLGKICRLCFYS